MKTSFTNMPPHKQQELAEIIEIVRGHSEVEMLILFGSYARGDWREKLSDDGVHYILQSDFDLLVVVETPSTAKQNRLERDIKSAIDQIPAIQTPVSVMVHDLKFVNRRLARTQYFFSDIQKQGVMLYDSGRFKLDTPKQLNSIDRCRLAKEDFEYWFTRAKEFHDHFYFSFERERFSVAAFELHQVVERLYSAILLVYTRYKPNTHSLEILRRLVNALDARFTRIFPLNNSTEKYHFKLLCNAYVEARYKPSYAITKEELSWLGEQVKELMLLADELCQEKISYFSRGGE